MLMGAPVHPRSLSLLLLVFVQAVRGQQGCCCAVPRAASVLHNIHEKTVSGCARAQCNGVVVQCSSCNAYNMGEGCRFCQLPTHKSCGKLTCADWCASSPKPCAYDDCSGCEDCKEDDGDNVVADDAPSDWRAAGRKASLGAVEFWHAAME